MLTDEMMPAVRLLGLRDVSLQEIEKVTKIYLKEGFNWIYYFKYLL